MFDYDQITRRFLLGEVNEPDLKSYIQSLNDILLSLRPASLKEKRRINMALKNLKEIKRHSKRLEEKLVILEEQVELLEENKD